MIVSVATCQLLTNARASSEGVPAAVSVLGEHLTFVFLGISVELSRRENKLAVVIVVFRFDPSILPRIA